MKRLVSWNVNGIRACVNKGFVQWMNDSQPDFICLQEIKANKDQFPDTIFSLDNYHLSINSAKKKGYSGVAIFSKEKPLKIIDNIGIEKFDSEGRTLILEFKNFILINGYFPNGQRDHGRVPFKLEYYERILEIYKEYEASGKNIIITGDFNTSHHPIDLANPKANKKSTGFLEIEREMLDTYLEAGMTDAQRYFHPKTEGLFTWWTYRGDCRERNIGWRLDYFMVSPKLIKKMESCIHHPQVLGSDHCPVELTLNYK